MKNTTLATTTNPVDHTPARSPNSIRPLVINVHRVAAVITVAALLVGLNVVGSLASISAGIDNEVAKVAINALREEAKETEVEAEADVADAKADAEEAECVAAAAEYVAAEAEADAAEAHARLEAQKEQERWRRMFGGLSQVNVRANEFVLAPSRQWSKRQAKARGRIRHRRLDAPWCLWIGV